MSSFSYHLLVMKLNRVLHYGINEVLFYMEYSPPRLSSRVTEPYAPVPDSNHQVLNIMLS